jgi:hypothetical protein
VARASLGSEIRYAAMSLTPEQLVEVTSHVGFAVWQIQILEATVGCYLVIVHKAKPGIARSEVETMFSKAGKSTLGQLLKSIQSTENAPQTLVEQLDHFVEKRNWLVHHSRHESHGDMYSESKRLALVQRIETIATDALALMQQFTAATNAHMIANGFNKEQMDNEAARIRNEWRKSS